MCANFTMLNCRVLGITTHVPCKSIPPVLLKPISPFMLNSFTLLLCQLPVPQHHGLWWCQLVLLLELHSSAILWLCNFGCGWQRENQPDCPCLPCTWCRSHIVEVAETSIKFWWVVWTEDCCRLVAMVSSRWLRWMVHQIDTRENVQYPRQLPVLPFQFASSIILLAKVLGSFWVNMGDKPTGLASIRTYISLNVPKSGSWLDCQLVCILMC